MTEIRRLSLAELELQHEDELFLLICTGYNGQFWNEPSGYGIDPCEAKLWTRDEAIRQIKQGHERREVAVSARAYVDSFRLFTARVDERRRQEQRITVVEYFHDGEPPRETEMKVRQLAGYLARADVLGDADYAAASAEELLERGVLRFEGDPPIAIKGMWPPAEPEPEIVIEPLRLRPPEVVIPPEALAGLVGKPLVAGEAEPIKVGKLAAIGVDPVQRYVGGCLRLSQMQPDDPGLDDLVGELDVLDRAMTPEQRAAAQTGASVGTQGFARGPAGEGDGC
jgi:hypothetical protein